MLDRLLCIQFILVFISLFTFNFFSCCFRIVWLCTDISYSIFVHVDKSKRNTEFQILSLHISFSVHRSSEFKMHVLFSFLFFFTAQVFIKLKTNYLGRCFNQSKAFAILIGVFTCICNFISLFPVPTKTISKNTKVNINSSII